MKGLVAGPTARRGRLPGRADHASIDKAPLPAHVLTERHRLTGRPIIATCDGCKWLRVVGTSTGIVRKCDVAKALGSRTANLRKNEPGCDNNHRYKKESTQ